MEYKKFLLCLLLLVICTNVFSADQKTVIVLNSESKECGYLLTETGSNEANLSSGWKAYFNDSELLLEIDIYDFNKQICFSPLTLEKVENCCREISFFYAGEIKEKDKVIIIEPQGEEVIVLPEPPSAEENSNQNDSKTTDFNANDLGVNPLVEKENLPVIPDTNLIDSIILPLGIVAILLIIIFWARLFLVKKKTIRTKKKRFAK